MPDIDPFFAELEAEISQATAKSKLKADAAQLKKQSHNMMLSRVERARAAEEFKSLQGILEASLWKAVAIGAMFTEQHCDGCDTIHHTFLQYMQQEQKVNNPTTKRWIRLLVPVDYSLPRETIVQPVVTHMCAACAPEHGFNVDAPTIRLLPSFGTLSVSATYEQGDINGPSQEN